MEREVLSAILDRIAKEDLERIGKEFGPRLVKEHFFYYGIAPTLSSLVTNYFEPAGRYSGRYEFHVVGSSGQPKLVLMHRYGEKWSSLLKEYTAGVIESVLSQKPRIETDSNILAIELGDSVWRRSGQGQAFPLTIRTQKSLFPKRTSTLSDPFGRIKDTTARASCHS